MYYELYVLCIYSVGTNQLLLLLRAIVYAQLYNKLHVLKASSTGAEIFAHDSRYWAYLISLLRR